MRWAYAQLRPTASRFGDTCTMPERIAIVDTETTGFDAQAELLELGVVVVDTTPPFLEVFAVSTLVRPVYFDAARHADAIAAHGIRPEDVANAPEPAAVRAWLADGLAAFSVRALTAYNVAFDRRMLAAYYTGPWDPCILHAARQRWPGQRMQLADAVRLAGGSEFSGHRALADARAAAIVWRYFQTCALGGER